MALDFGVENNKYDEAFKKLKQKCNSDPEYWENVEKSINEEAKKSSKFVESQKVEPDLMHRCFSL